MAKFSIEEEYNGVNEDGSTIEADEQLPEEKTFTPEQVKEMVDLKNIGDYEGLGLYVSKLI